MRKKTENGRTDQYIKICIVSLEIFSSIQEKYFKFIID